MIFRADTFLDTFCPRCSTQRVAGETKSAPCFCGARFSFPVPLRVYAVSGPAHRLTGPSTQIRVRASPCRESRPPSRTSTRGTKRRGARSAATWRSAWGGTDGDERRGRRKHVHVGAAAVRDRERLVARPSSRGIIQLARKHAHTRCVTCGLHHPSITRAPPCHSCRGAGDVRRTSFLARWSTTSRAAHRAHSRSAARCRGPVPYSARWALRRRPGGA